MAAIPESTRASLTWKLMLHADKRWPQIKHVKTRFRGTLAYVDAEFRNGASVKLRRPRYAGSASVWGFSIWRASHDDYQDSRLPTGMPSGSPEDALDTACGLHLADPTAWTNQTNPTPTNTTTSSRRSTVA
ncbi:MAG: hypothetical protein LBU05_04895 [Bifidobacteriaceae bacterium]|nr:hypothetical protein [Bifidobacteriaceae bacterium]